MILVVPYFSSPGFELQEKGNKDILVPLVVCIAVAYFLGDRPVAPVFGDTMSYSRIYNNLQYGIVNVDWHSEWLWSYIMMTCKSLGFSVHGWFCVVAFGYFLSMYIALIILTPKNVYLTLMFVLSSAFIFSFCVNGMRNGLACHITLAGIALALQGRYPLAAVAGLIAFGIHKSAILPIAACVAGLFMRHGVKYSIWLWLSCIPLSLVAGGFFMSFFSSLGFDSRMESYTADQDMSRFSGSGFRWDFLIYSSMPVLMAWWVCIKKQISDNWYNVLCVTYCLCNSFWILVIRAAYSNRFAYLSWFLYPVIIAYPLVMLPVWDDQDTKSAIILLAYLGSTVALSFMWGMIVV